MAGTDRADADAVADLHVHTVVSDGTLTLDRVPAAARAAGLDCVALTDHDRYHPRLDAPVTERAGVTLVRGLELRVEAPEAGERLDLLGYGVTPTAALDAELDRLRRDRIERGRELIERVEGRLGIDLGIEAREGIGRPHVARAVAASDAPHDYQGAFDELIGEGRPCYVPRSVPTFDRGAALLADACPVVGLAHPYRYDDPEAALDLATGLDAVERYYPYDAPPADGGRAVERAIESAGLLGIGGSDAHDETLGRAGPPREAFAAFARRVGRAQA